MTYQPPEQTNWKGRKNAPGNLKTNYWYQAVHCRNVFYDQFPALEQNEKGVALLGFCCDEGVRRNQGRPGAAQGPAAIRQQLSKLSWHLDDKIVLVDAGDVQCLDDNLEGAQQALGEAVEKMIDKNYFPIVLGGGHETAWGHYLGLKHFHSGLGIINFDAHFDLRDDEWATSGTPFAQIARQQVQSGFSFLYSCLGMLPQYNPPVLFEKQNRLGVQFLSRDQISLERLDQNLQWLQRQFNQAESVYVSIDLDVFNVAVAPGVSAINPMGILPRDILPFLDVLLASGKMVSLDLVELNPAFDRDHQTARLAANLVYHVLNRMGKGFGSSAEIDSPSPPGYAGH